MLLHTIVQVDGKHEFFCR